MCTTNTIILHFIYNNTRRHDCKDCVDYRIVLILIGVLYSSPEVAAKNPHI
jgi:hypothetical protein